jgi:hypothetical protein
MSPKTNLGSETPQQEPPPEMQGFRAGAVEEAPNDPPNEPEYLVLDPETIVINGRGTHDSF